MIEAREAPLVLVYEDLHWADPTSRDLVAQLIDTIREARLLLGRDIDADLIRDGLRNFSLPRKNAGKIACISVGPDGTIVSGIDELHADAHFIAIAQHSALNNGIHRQFMSNFGEILRGAFVAHGRCEGNDAERGNLAQVVDQLFRHSVGEIVLRSITG